MAEESKGKMSKIPIPDIKKLGELFKGEKGQKRIILLGIIGMVLILLSSFLGKGSDKRAKVQTSEQALTAAQYETELEQRLSSIISQINGVGRARVMITLENGVKNIYATDTEIETQTEYGEHSEPDEKYKEQNNIVIIDSDGGKQALLTTRIEPRVKGVIIVCEGGSSAYIKQQVTEAATIALDIPSSKVCVTA